MGNAIVAVHADMYQTMVLQASSYGPSWHQNQLQQGSLSRRNIHFTWKWMMSGNETIYIVSYITAGIQLLIFMYVFQLIQEVAELMGDQVGCHCTTLSCIEDIHVRMVLKWWADDPIAQLQISTTVSSFKRKTMQLSCPFLISFNGMVQHSLQPAWY